MYLSAGATLRKEMVYLFKTLSDAGEIIFGPFGNSAEPEIK